MWHAKLDVTVQEWEGLNEQSRWELWIKNGITMVYHSGKHYISNKDDPSLPSTCWTHRHVIWERSLSTFTLRWHYTSHLLTTWISIPWKSQCSPLDIVFFKFYDTVSKCTENFEWYFPWNAFKKLLIVTLERIGKHPNIDIRAGEICLLPARDQSFFLKISLKIANDVLPV